MYDQSLEVKVTLSGWHLLVLVLLLCGLSLLLLHSHHSQSHSNGGNNSYGKNYSRGESDNYLFDKMKLFDKLVHYSSCNYSETNYTNTAVSGANGTDTATKVGRRDEDDRISFRKGNVKIAYVFAGSARSFTCPKVHWSIRSHLIDALGGEPFVFVRISTEDNKNTKTGMGINQQLRYKPNAVNETLKVLNPREVEYFTFQGQEKEMNQQYPGKFHDLIRKNDKRRYSMYFHRSMAYKMVQRYEQQHGVRFDWVMLTRLDAQWLEPILPVTAYANDRIWITETGHSPFNDQFMMIPRNFSDYVYDLNTKIVRGVYCLGGPDIEQWKCNREQLAVRNYTKEQIEENMAACCPMKIADTGDADGYSERIHFRHLRTGKIPVSMGRFPVFLVRTDPTDTSKCMPECFRIFGYNYKKYMFNLDRSHYPYMATHEWPDTYGYGVSTRDYLACNYIASKQFPWNPTGAVDLHTDPGLASAYSPLDYTKDIYKQLSANENGKMPTLLALSSKDVEMWRIRLTFNADQCLTQLQGTKFIQWSTCVVSISGVKDVSSKHDTRQLFFANVFPVAATDNRSVILEEAYRGSRRAEYDTKRSITPVKDLYIPRVYAERQSVSFLWVNSPKYTRIVIPELIPPVMAATSRLLCLTAATYAVGSPLHLLDCSVDSAKAIEIGKVDPTRNSLANRQLFLPVVGIAPGPSYGNTIAGIQLAVDPSLCVARNTTITASNVLYVAMCDTLTFDLLTFEFEFIAS